MAKVLDLFGELITRVRDFVKITRAESDDDFPDGKAWQRLRVYIPRIAELGQMLSGKFPGDPVMTAAVGSSRLLMVDIEASAKADEADHEWVRVAADRVQALSDNMTLAMKEHQKSLRMAGSGTGKGSNGDQL